jgi:Ser/Thr protein kinase RdoA (MazF antagonist)
MIDKLETPLVHLNGTSKKALLEQLQVAANSLYAARKSLYDASPHGRDYYPKEAGAFKRAAEQHESRIKRLSSVYEELSALMEAVADQGDD